jgi:hypothetical protein
MRIDGLTTEQVEMLDKLWSLDTMEEVQEFRSSLPRFRQQQIDTLMEMIMHEICEEKIESATSYPDAEKVLQKIIKKSS